MAPLVGRETRAAGFDFAARARVSTSSDAGGAAATDAGTAFALRVAVVAEGLTVAVAGGGALGAMSGTRAARLAVRVGSFGNAMSGSGPARMAGVLGGAGIGSKDARLART